MGNIRDLLEKYMCSDCSKEYCLHFSKGTVCNQIHEAEKEIREALPSEKEIEETLKDKPVICSICSEEKQDECDIQEIWCEEYNELSKQIKALYEKRLF